MNHSVVQRWLRQVIGPYNDQDRVYADVDRSLTSLPSLSPKTEVYTYDDGRSQLLLEITGTIPIQYRTATYNIPMAFWIPRSYPRDPPLVYVTPTNDMLVRKGKHVDLSGRVGGAYLDQWQRKWEACNLLDLIRDCQAMFGQEPPVYAKPRNVVAPVATSSRQSSSPSSSPSSHQQHFASPQRTPSLSTDRRERAPPAPPNQQHQQQPSHHEGGPPLRPPKPGQSASDDPTRRFSNGSLHVSPLPSHHHPAYQYALAPQQPHRGSRDYGAPPYSAEPSSLPMSPSAGPSYAHLNATSPQSRHTSWSGPGSLPPHMLQGQATGGHRSASYSSSGSSADTARGAGGPPVPPPLPPQHVYGGYQQPQAGPAEGPAVPAPPRPPNPELLQMHGLLHAKIQARLQHLHTTAEASQGQMKVLGEDLDRGELAVKDEMARLEAVRDVCRATGDQLQEAVDAGSRRAAELRAREEPDVDGLLSATSLVGNQLIDLVAEDNAIEDTLYHLGRALNSEILDLDRFLKQTRFLAREQFMRRALAQKVSRGMGWEST